MSNPVPPRALHDSMLANKSRRSKAESALRRLMYTSYPHAMFSNIVLMILKGAQADEGTLLETADILEGVEDDYHLFDFPRYFEIKREGDIVTVTVKRMSGLEDTSVKDTRDNHEELRSVSMDIGSEMVLTNPHDIATYLINRLFFVVLTPKHRPKDINDMVWTYYVKSLRLDEGERLSDLRCEKKKNKLHHKGVVAAIAHSLTKPQFLITLTPRTLTCHDQDIKITT